MPAPLIWLGAAALGAYSASKANDAYLKRKDVVDTMPGGSNVLVKPRNGSVVTCGIYGVLDHTGIWVDGNIYELSGKGLVRCVSPKRFLGDRSGNTIYIACDTFNRPLYEMDIAERAQNMLYQFIDYHLLNDNCHKFVAEVIAKTDLNITSFSDFNTFLSDYYSTPIRWNLTQINKRALSF